MFSLARPKADESTSIYTKNKFIFLASDQKLKMFISPKTKMESSSFAIGLVFGIGFQRWVSLFSHLSGLQSLDSVIIWKGWGCSWIYHATGWFYKATLVFDGKKKKNNLDDMYMGGFWAFLVTLCTEYPPWKLYTCYQLSNEHYS